MLVAAVVMVLGVSGYALEYFGIPYVSPGGSVVTKLHPSLYLFCAALALAVIANRDPIFYAGSLIARRLGAVALIVAAATIFVVMFRIKPQLFAASLVDSIAAAGVIALVLADAPARVRLLLARIVHALVAANCALAIVEVATGWRLFPFGVGGAEFTWDYRATALFGHPLDAALAVGIYGVILLTSRKVFALPDALRLPMILLVMASMPAIGSRTSFAIVYGVAALVVAWHALGFLRGAPLPRSTLLAVAVGAPVAVAALMAAFQLGVFDAFVGRFESDSGSASARFELFELFRDFGVRELFVGYDIGELVTRVRVIGIEAGIENAWAGHLLLYGLPLSVILWCALAAFLWEIVRECGRPAILPILFMLVINTASVGISGKTTMLVLPTVIILILLGGRAAPAASAAAPFRRPA